MESSGIRLIQWCQLALFAAIVLLAAPASSQENTNVTEIQPEENMMEGDMMDFDPTIINKLGYKSGLLLKEYLWDDATMYYRFAPNVSVRVRKRLREAMKNIEKHTCIRFVMHKDGMDDVSDWYEIVQAPQDWLCASSVGLICKNLSLECQHKMRLGEDCILGSLVHELMHALGFVHEQSRDDRDDHVIIQLENVKDPFGANFKKYGFPLRHLTPYDYESIMHYDQLAFSDPEKHLPTIQPKRPLPNGVKLGQRDRLSRYDIQKLNGLYNCTTRRKRDHSRWYEDANRGVLLS